MKEIKINGKQGAETMKITLESAGIRQTFTIKKELYDRIFDMIQEMRE